MSQVYDVLRRIDRGNLADDMDEAIREVCQAIHDNGKGKGSITLTISIKGDPADEHLRIGGELKVAKPKQRRADAIFWYDDENGALLRKDPFQDELPSLVEADKVNKVS